MDTEINLSEYLKMESFLPSQVKAVRIILLDKHDLPVPDHCDEFICRCLRLKDGNTEKAVKLIKAFHAITLDFKDWDTPLLPSLFEYYYNVGIVTPMIKRDSQGRHIFIFRSDSQSISLCINQEKWNPQKTNFDELLAGLWIMAQYVNAEFTELQRIGYVVLFDFSNFSLQQAWAVKQMKLVTILRWVQNSVIGRIKALHVVFHPQIVRVIYSAIKPFLKEKLKKRIIFHDNLESLHKQVGSECLPDYLGGPIKDGEGIDKAMIKDLVSKDDFFKDIMKNRIPEK